MTLAAACPASAPCVFSLTADGSYPSEFTAANVLYAASWGVGVVLSLWFIGYVVGLATGLIRRV